jgi:hypothetical protein
MMALLSRVLSHPIDWWVKFAQIVQGLSTPFVAGIIGVISVRIQRHQSRIQKQQAMTNRRQYRLSLFERRMKVFDSTMGFISLVNRDAEIRGMESLLKFQQDTREHRLLFGGEIAEYITEIFEKGNKLRTFHSLRDSGKPVDVNEDSKIVEWFSEQIAAAPKLFLKYIDFRQPY